MGEPVPQNPDPIRLQKNPAPFHAMAGDQQQHQRLGPPFRLPTQPMDYRHHPQKPATEEIRQQLLPAIAPPERHRPSVPSLQQQTRHLQGHLRYNLSKLPEKAQ
jgi:hypothetical protein